MNARKLVTGLLASLMAMFCVATCSGQTVKIKEKLPNGEYIIEVDGTEQRTITADHAREIAQAKIDLAAAHQDNAMLVSERDSLKAALDAAVRKAALDAREINLIKLERDAWQNQYNAEHSLRLASEKLQGGRVSNFFNNPGVQIFFKAALPVANTILSSLTKK